jgi:serine/threonine protein kinase
MRTMLQAGEEVGVYRVVTRVGAGATAEVYRIRHQRLQAEYALKVLHPRGPSDIRRLENEGVVQSKLHHPNIVQVMNVVEVGNSIGLIMEYVEGSDLATWLETHRPTLSEALDLFDGIVRGVQHAHDAGLVHRDLKPANVLLQRVREGLIPKVSDFGIAKIFGEGMGTGQTMAGIAMGTPRYMAPEQFTDAASVDQRADLFSLGCILFELVTGQTAFAPANVFEAHDSARLAAYGQLPDALPEQVKKAIRGALEPDRDKRIRDCQSLLEALGRPTHLMTTSAPVRVISSPPTKPPPRSEEQPYSNETLAPPGTFAGEGGQTSAGFDATLEAPKPKMASAPVLQPVTVAPAPKTAVPKSAATVGLVGGLIAAMAVGLGVMKLWPAEPVEPVSLPADPVVVVEPVEVPPAEIVSEPPPDAAIPPTHSVVADIVPPSEPVKPVVGKTKTVTVSSPPAVVVDPGALVKQAKVNVKDAQDIEVTCGSTKATSDSSVMIRKFVAGPCRVRARFGETWLTAQITITEPVEVNCAADAGTLSCAYGPP